VLYTSALRRLQGVTQVVGAEEGAVFHNRLTHTLETAQIGRRIAEKLRPKLPEEVDWLHPEIVEAAALAHDLGHPPFGHIAEVELDRLLTAEHCTDGYEGNAQTFRIVTKLAVNSTEYSGLNLSRATLNAILKYPWMREPKRTKWGAYRSEREDFDWARKLHPEGSESRCLEAEVMTWADDIAYSVHDSEDFYRAGLIPLQDLGTEKGQDKFFASTFQRWDEENVKSEFDRKDLKKAFRELCDTLPVNDVYQGTLNQRANLRRWTSFLIKRYVMNTELRRIKDWESRLGQEGEWVYLRIDQIHLMEIKMLKELTWAYVIKTPSLASQQHGERTIIRKLFEIFAEAATGGPKRWTILPQGTRVRLAQMQKEQGTIEGADALRAAADTIACMTDHEAVRLYQRLMGFLPGTVLDPIIH
jgi:dGTPase